MPFQSFPNIFHEPPPRFPIIWDGPSRKNFFVQFLYSRGMWSHFLVSKSPVICSDRSESYRDFAFCILLRFSHQIWIWCNASLSRVIYMKIISDLRNLIKFVITELFASLRLFWCFCCCKKSIQNGLSFLKRYIFLVFWTKMSWTFQSRFSFIGNIPFFCRAKRLCAPTYTFWVYTEYRFTDRGWIFFFFCRF